MSIWKYKYFVDVIDCKSFTKAGKKNFVTQTAISQQIASLEKKIGGKLIERGNGEIMITELGRIVYNHSKEMLKINDKMMDEIKQLMRQNIVQVGVDNSINREFWARLQNILDEYYSEEDFSFNKIDFKSGSQMLKEKELDIYIGYELEDKEECSNIEEMVLASHESGVYLGKNTSIPEMEALSLLSLEGYTRYSSDVYPCSTQEIVDEDGNRIEHENVRNIDTLKLKVEFNDGYAIVDSFYFSKSDGEIRQLKDYDGKCVLKAFYRNRKKKAAQFLTYLQEK